MCPAAAPAAFRPCASVAPAASAAAFLAAPASSTPSGSLDCSQTTPARVNTWASDARELLVAGGGHERGAGVHHLLRVRRAAEAGDAVRRRSARCRTRRRRQPVGRDEALGDRHDRRAPRRGRRAPSAAITSPSAARGHRQEHVVGARHARRGGLDAQLRRQLDARQVAWFSRSRSSAAPARRCASAASCAARRARAAPRARSRTSPRRSPSPAWRPACGSERARAARARRAAE